MGQEMDHPHATAQVIGHGRDELSPRHILDSDIVVRIRVSLAQIFTQEFDCPVSCGVGNGKIVTPYNKVLRHDKKRPFPNEPPCGEVGVS